jgi:hypothetical protein
MVASLQSSIIYNKGNARMEKLRVRKPQTVKLYRVYIHDHTDQSKMREKFDLKGKSRLAISKPLTYQQACEFAYGMFYNCSINQYGQILPHGVKSGEPTFGDIWPSDLIKNK